LYQEVLYERIPAGRRQRLHRRIGERAETAYGKQTREIAAELAVHFERGRELGKAIQYLQQAGENAMQRSANYEAISLLTKGLELLKRLPDTPERTQQELTLRVALGPVLGMTQGFAAPEVEKVYVRACELYQQVEATPQLFPILSGLWGFYNLRAELQIARGLAEQLLTLAQRSQDPTLLVRAHEALGYVLFSLGDLALAREHLEQAGVVCSSNVTHVLWLLGYPDQALQRSHEALTLAQELAHPFGLAVALNMAAALHQFRREVEAAQARVEAALTFSREQGFAVLLAMGTILWGCALAEQGREEEGIAQIRQGLAAYRATGTEVHRPHLLARLAEAYGKEGQAEEGLTLLAEALATVEKTGERYCEAELYRLKGTLTLQSKTSLGQVAGKSKTSQGKSKTSHRQVSDKSQASHGQVKDKSEVTNPQHPTPYTQAEVEREAEGCFQKAIEIARRQSAKSLELRATMSLARLWQQQGKKKQARKMLAEIYGWFTEGFDTKDLQEARTLLEKLTER
jgi:predicted ATPase